MKQVLTVLLLGVGLSVCGGPPPPAPSSVDGHLDNLKQIAQRKLRDRATRQL